MKYLFFILLIVWFGSLNAQSFWSVAVDDEHYSKSHVTDIALFQDSIVLISGFVNNISCEGNVLLAFDLQGNRLWSIDDYQEKITTDENFIYTIGFYNVDDVAGYTQVVFGKYDKHGNEVFRLGYPELPHQLNFWFEPLEIEIIDGGLIIAVSENVIVKSDTAGTFISIEQFNWPSGIKGFSALHPTAYLIHTANTLYKTDSALALIDSVSFTDEIKDVRNSDDTLLLLFHTRLIRLDTNLAILDTLFTAPAGGLVKMEQYDNALWVQQSDGNNMALFKFNQNAVMDTLYFERLTTNIKFIVSDNNYGFIGDSPSGQISMYSFKNPISGINYAPTLHNIEITDFDIDSITYDYQNPLDPTQITGYRFNTEVTVKNVGGGTIESFAIFTQLFGGVFCASNYLYQKFSGMTILPGQSETVMLERAFQQGLRKELCFEVLAPGSELETEINNNTLCKTFLKIGITEAHEPVIKVYPNPASSRVIIEHKGLNIQEVVLTDIEGRNILRQSGNSDVSVLDVSGISPGTYLVELVSNENKITRLVHIQ